MSSKLIEVFDAETKTVRNLTDSNGELVLPPDGSLPGKLAYSCLAELDGTRIIRSGGIVFNGDTIDSAHIFDMETKQV